MLLGILSYTRKGTEQKSSGMWIDILKSGSQYPILLQIHHSCRGRARSKNQEPAYGKPKNDYIQPQYQTTNPYEEKKNMELQQLFSVANLYRKLKWTFLSDLQYRTLFFKFHIATCFAPETRHMSAFQGRILHYFTLGRW